MSHLDCLRYGIRMKPPNIRRGNLNTYRKSLLAAALVFSAICTQAQVVITLPTVILSDHAPVTVPLLIHNSGAAFQLVGFELDIQVEDGGPEAGGSTLGPAITHVDILSAGLLFESNNNGLSGTGLIVPQLYSTGTLTQPDTTVNVPTGDTTLAQITLDATGRTSTLTSWSWTLSTLNGSTTLINPAGNSMDITLGNGDISIGDISPVPEPGNWAIVAGTLAGIGYGLRRCLRTRWRLV